MTTTDTAPRRTPYTHLAIEGAMNTASARPTR